MGEVTVMFSLPDDAYDALQSTARREGAPPGAILRAALQRHLRRNGTDENGENPRGKPDTAFIGALRTLLSRDIADATDWADLDARLSKRGYDLRLIGNQLALFTTGSNDCIADGTEIGVSYGAMMRRFGGPMPPQKAHRA